MISERAKFIQALVVAIGVNISIAGFAVWLSGWNIASLEQEFTASVQRLTELEDTQRAIGDVGATLTESEALAGETERLFFVASKESVTRILEILEGLAVEEGLTIDIANAMLEETGKRQSPAQFDLRLVGSFAGVMNMVSEIESGPFLARVEALNVSGGENDVNATLTITFERL